MNSISHGHEYVNSTEIAKSYHRRRWAIIPLKGKEPQIAGWDKLAYLNEEAIGSDFVGANIGVRLGAASGNLLCLDLDCEEAIRAANVLLPPTATFGRRGIASHYLYVADASRDKAAFKAPGEAKPLIELLGDGQQVVMPPSVYDNGDVSAWTYGETPAQIALDSLECATGKVAAAALIAKEWGEGGRHNLAQLWGGYFAHSDYPEEEALTLIEAVCAAARDAEERDRITAVRDSYRKYDEGEEVTGYPTLIQTCDARLVRRVSQWLGIEHTPSVRVVDSGGASVVQYTPLWNAQLFREKYAGELLYCIEQERWLLWNGRYWEPDKRNKAYERAGQIVRTLVADLANKSGADLRDAAKWVSKCSGAGAIEEMLTLASRMFPEMKVSLEDLDSRPGLLTVRNGTFDFDAGELLGFDREHLITKIVDVDYNPEAESRYVLPMLQEAIGDDATMREAQKGLGLAPTGYTEKAMFFCYGPTDTGKTTFLTEVVQNILGDYAKQLSLESIAHGRDRNQHLWAADLYGARFALASETPEGYKLDVATVKAMTGDTTQIAKAHYQMPFAYKPTYTMFMDTNFRPEIPNADDDAIWGRVKLVHFKNKVRRERSEPGYVEDFKSKIASDEEREAVLRWMIEGYRLYREEGLRETANMQQDKQDYRDDSDVYADFFDSCLERVEGGKVPVADVTQAFDSWYRAMGLQQGDKPSTLMELPR